MGGLVIRMPLEVELRRNYKHSLMGQKLREILQKRVDKEESKKKLIEQRDDKTNDTFNRTQSSKSKNTINPRQNASSVSASSSSVPCVDRMEMAIWYAMAQNLVEAEMNVIAGAAGADNELDSTTLNDLSSEVLALFLDHQETWQEVCLVLEHNAQSSTTLVLNRPMALQLTDALGRMVLHGTFATEKGPSLSKTIQKKKKLPSMKDFLKAFGKECGVYLGGLDDQHLPAILIHGIADLPGATEIAIGTGVYRGGVEAAVAGVLAGKYKPLEFRFFVGRHSYSTADKTDDDEGLVDDGGMRLENFGKELKDLIGGADDEDEYEEEEQEFNIPTSLELEVVLGKYQPIACARSLVLKQCIQLPKPLWHEVLELCGGELKDISELEQLKPVDTQFQIVDDDDDDEDDDEFDFIAFDTGDEDDEDDDDDDEEEFYKI